jgi:hypothetical protein
VSATLQIVVHNRAPTVAALKPLSSNPGKS